MANARAAKDLLGLIGLKGGFMMTTGTGAVSLVTGEGFTVEADSAAVGAFKIYFKEGFCPVEIYDIKISAFTPKGASANGDDYMADISGWNLTAARPYVTGRLIDKTTLVVGAETAIVGFNISGRYSDVGIYN